jgi:RNA polymerase sigma-70 factor (ECF subfamily)
MRPTLHALPDPENESFQREEDAIGLLYQIGQEDRFALDTLYQLWAPTLLGVALRILHDREEAEEAIQDTFVKIWHRAADYDAQKSKAFVWCFALLRNVCIDKLRFNNRQKRSLGKTVSWDERDAPEPHSDANVLSLDTLAIVRNAIGQLPIDERRCLELAVFLEYTHTEISSELQTPLGTVKNRLRRAMEKLQKMLAEHEF